MTISVTVPNGATVQFPDGTDRETIHGVLMQHFGPKPPFDPSQPVQAEDKPPFDPSQPFQAANKKTFEITSPEGKRYTVQGPEGATPEQAFQILQKYLGRSAPAAAPVSANDAGRSFATGVPIIGGSLNKLDAATNAALAPVLNRFFDEKDQLPEASFSDRYAHSLRDQEGADARFAKDHPYVDTAAQVAGSIASTAPFMMAAPKAFGLTGTLPQMVRNGAISGAALSGADAASRGQNPVDAALTGGVIGGAAGPVGRLVGRGGAAIADRVRPPAAVPQAVKNVAGVDVPLSQAEVTQNPALSAEQQIMLRGGRGDAAQANAQGFKDLQDARMNQARGNIAAGLDPTGSAATTSPQDAAERIAAELIAQEQARQAAGAGVHAGPMSPAPTRRGRRPVYFMDRRRGVRPIRDLQTGSGCSRRAIPASEISGVRGDRKSARRRTWWQWSPIHQRRRSGRRYRGLPNSRRPWQRHRGQDMPELKGAHGPR